MGITLKICNTQLGELYSPIIPACDVQHFQWPAVEVMYCLYWIRHLSYELPRYRAHIWNYVIFRRIFYLFTKYQIS